MKIAALLILISASLSACASYQPSQANCFNFLPVEDGGDCTFTPLGGPTYG